MESYQLDYLAITINKEGAREFFKVSYPIRYGRFSEIKTEEHIFQFNLKGEIKYIQGRSQTWPYPGEWLKRTAGNDWVYYSASDYGRAYDLFGEYYLPYLSYPSNSIMGDNPFEDSAVRAATKALQRLRKEIRVMIPDITPQNLKELLLRVVESDAKTLRLRSQRLHHLVGGRLTVLPPDTRHVDYEVIPIIVADGCLYNCGFCRVKSGQDFAPRTRENVLRQIENLEHYYAQDLCNYNAIFLGYHDALGAGRELLEFAATNAYERFELERSYLKGSWLFLFGSADSMINSEETLWEWLNSLSFSTYINIGLESADAATLSALKKPVTAEKVAEAFARMIDINRRYEKIEVTANFVIGNDLPPSHLDSLLELTKSRLDRFSNKGGIYLSPLIDEGNRNVWNRREILRKFNQIKTTSLLPTYIYLIQRL